MSQYFLKNEVLVKQDACRSKRVAIQIGINYYNTENQLNGCESDVEMMHDILQTRFGITEFIVMIQKTSPPHLQPTRANIIRVLTEVAQRTKTDGVELVAVQYSGHGTISFDQSGDEGPATDENAEGTTGCDSLLVPSDMQMISDDELRSIVNQFSPWCRVFALIDACHSGTAFDLPLLYGANTAGCLMRTNETAPVCDMIAISGCKDCQTSSDVSLGAGKAGGAMTMAFRDQMFKNGTIFELMNGLTEYMQKNGHTQRPQLSSSRPLHCGISLSHWLR